jgi:hypothetical protein
LLMCLLRLTVRVIMRERRRCLNYLRGKGSGSDYLRFATEWPPAALRQHRQLQCEHCSASGGDRQNPLSNPRNEIDLTHVCILRLSELIEYPTECAARAWTTNAVSDYVLREP